MRLILPVLLSFGLFCASYAQQPDTLCTATVGELSAEVAALKAKTSAWDKVLAALPAISGYLQTGYEWSDNSSSFFIKRVRLSLSGNIAPNSTTAFRSNSRRRRSWTHICVTGRSTS